MQYYDGYVAFIDVLGFSQWITKTENIDKTNEFFEVVKMIKTLFDSNPEWKCKLYIFSDSVVMTSKVDYQRFFLAISLLENCLWEELDLLYRGGIAKGSFYEDDDNIVFGPAVVHAVELEKEAEESRIVLSKDIDVSESNWYVFRDFDGRCCWNPYSVAIDRIIFDYTRREGNDGETNGYVEPIISFLNQKREELMTKVLSCQYDEMYGGNKEIESRPLRKYIWRSVPFNYTCDFLCNRFEEVVSSENVKELSEEQKKTI